MQTIGEIIATYRKQTHLSQSELSDLLVKNGHKISNKAIFSWEKNKTEPSSSLLLLLCKLLSITDIYEEYYGVNPDNLLSEQIRKAKKKRWIILFDIPASAGTGSFLDGDSFATIEVGEEVPQSADFGIRTV